MHNQNIKVLQLAAAGVTMRRLLKALIDRQIAEGYDVRLACADGDDSREMSVLGYQITPIHIERRIGALSNLRTVADLYRLMRRERFDVVHVHTPIAAVLGRVAAKMARVPLVFYTAHGFYFHEHMKPYVRKPIVWLERAMGRMTDMIFSQSEEDAQTAIREKIGLPGKVQCIKNGVDLSRFAAQANGARASFGLEPGDRVVGFVGRMVGEKGILELVEAMHRVVREVPRAKLLLVGGTLDSDRDSGFSDLLRDRISADGLAHRTVFAGYSDDIAGAMAAMDLFVLPSYREGMPRTVIEAMASAKPVVATDIRGCREEVVHGETGLLVPIRNAHALADAIIEVLRDPECARRMGLSGQERAQRLFDERDVVQRQMETYRRLLTEAGLIERSLD